MRYHPFTHCFLTLLCAAAFASASSAEAASGVHAQAAVEDTVYLQEVGEKLPTEAPVTSVAVLNGNLYAVMDGKVKVLNGTALDAAAHSPKKVLRLEALDGALWALADSGVHRFDGQNWTRVSDQPFIDLCMHLGAVHGATKDALFRYEDGAFVSTKPEGGYLSNDSTMLMEDGTQVLADPVEIGPITGIASYSGTMYLMRAGGIALIDRKTFIPEPIDWGAMPSDVTRDMLAQGSVLYVATDRGLAALRGMALTTLAGPQGLPFEDTTCLAQGFDGDVWVGTNRGAVRMTGGDFHFFGPNHWLPGAHVNSIAVGDHVVYVATDTGLGIIRYEPYTLLKKAAWYEQLLNAWGYKRLGFVHKLWYNDTYKEWLREISDNDGGHTSHYLAAMSYKYAATGDPQARAEALEAFQAMIWLEDITKSDGFFARAIWSEKADKGQRSTRGSGGLPAKWYTTEDGLWSWKGDTSSDEVNGHMFAASVFHDLVAQGAEKDRAKLHIARIASHIMDNGWVLRDMDGKPTRWGRWDPQYLFRPYGYEARGLNGMEAQTYMWTAFALTGDAKFKAGLQQLVDWGYPNYTVRQRHTFPPDLVVPWDDELAFRCYYPLLKYADDPELRSVYLRSLERSWEVLRMQHLPFFNFSYGALTGNPCEADRAVQHLRDWPLDCVNYGFRNSDRRDLVTEPGYSAYSAEPRAISPREQEASWGTRPAIQYNGGGNGKGATPPIGWLEDYWMGRYYGFIAAPTTTDPVALTPPALTGGPYGAKPYDGPPRPTGLIPGM